MTSFRSLRDALSAVSGGRDLETVAGLQDHLDAVLPAEERETWPTTPTGKLSTAKLILKLNRHLPGIAELLALREVKMLASTFGEGLIERLNPITGRLHPSFRIGSTIAGRFSCAGPNIQQQPARNKAFRSIFRAPEGSSIISCDFSQIELRTLAQIVRKDLAKLTGQDEETTLDGMFRTGQDIHWQTAKRMYALPADAVKEEHELLRSNAKAANFSAFLRDGARDLLQAPARRSPGDLDRRGRRDPPGVALNLLRRRALAEAPRIRLPPQRLRRDPAWPALVLVLARAWIRRRCPRTSRFATIS